MKIAADNIIRVCLAFLGIVLFVQCLLPLLLRRIINIGNSTGMILGVLLFIYAVFMRMINSFISSVWKNGFGRIVLCIFALALAAGCIVVIIESTLMYKAAKKTPPADATVIVLGCKVYGDRPSIMLQRRLDAAYDYLKANPGSLCIVSGGQGADEPVSEADCMYAYLLEKGISADRLYKEARSTSTRENLLFSEEIIRAEKMNTTIALVTNEFHEYRASLVARDLGLENYSIPGATPAWLFPTYYLRELYGIMYEWVF